MSDSYLLIDYVYLDSEERKRFAQASHEYLIEQLQFTGSESLTAATAKYRLNFNHPCKYLVWVPHLERHATRQNWIAWAAGASTWKEAADRFARVLFVATRTGATVDTGSAKVTTVPAVNVGDVIEPEQSGAVNAMVAALLSKIEVKIVVTVQAGGNSLVTLGTGLADLLNNTIVVRNNLTAEDLSKRLSDLSAGGANAAVLNLAAVSVVDHFNYGNFVDGTDNPVYSAKLQLNGHDRFQDRDGNYFNYVQPAQHFSNTPADGVNVYSFALKAEDHQPTGTCNFSRIDNATLQVQCGLYNSVATNYTDYLGSSSSSFVNIYTQNYNVLRVMSGMAGTAYSN
jgi:hypothetical protein